MPKGIFEHKPHSEETKRKMSKSRKGRKMKPMSEETKKNISKAKTGKKRKPHSEETISKIKEGNKGRKLLEETKRKMSVARKGKKHSIETIRKITDIQRGEKSHFWKGGISKEKYSIDWNNILRDSIRKRDDFICKECGIHQDELKGWSKKLDVHHIDYNKDNLETNNLISLCRSCHIKTNFNREYWIEYFNNNK